jgi:hypothetical protein
MDRIRLSDSKNRALLIECHRRSRVIRHRNSFKVISKLVDPYGIKRDLPCRCNI